MGLNTSFLKEEIMDRLKKGDERAMAPLYDLYHKSLYYFARQLTHNDEQAEDIVAEAFFKAWQRRTDFANIIALHSFMVVTIKNSCCNYLKHVQRKMASHLKIIDSSEVSEDYVEAQMVKANLIQLILLEVDNLPPIRKKIFKMIFLEDLSVFEIATCLNITVDTVRVQKARALHGIRCVILKKGLLA